MADNTPSQVYDSIFDAIMHADSIRQNRIEAKRLEQHNISMQNTCGSCKLWMTQKCPRESKSHKVSCNERKCQSFNMDGAYAILISNNEDKIKALTLPETK